MQPLRILWVFAWLVVGGEETEVRHLSRLLPSRYRIDVIACFRRDGMTSQTHEQLRALGVDVDTTPYLLSFAETVEYLARRVRDYDVVISSQAVPDIVPALRLAAERGGWVPPLIEHGGLVSEAEAVSADVAARYVGVCRQIRDAAAARMIGREHHCLEIPSLVDLDEFDPADRPGVRSEMGWPDDAIVFGWVGRLDRKKRVEDFVRAAALTAGRDTHRRFVVIGGPDAFMPEYAAELETLSSSLDLAGRLAFLGDRPDVPRLMSGLDALVWLARDEGMPHVVAEAGAARLPVIATRDNGTLEQIEDGISGLFVPYADPVAVAEAMERLAREPALMERLGRALRETVERQFSASVVVGQWQRLLDEVATERPRAAAPPGATGTEAATLAGR